MRAEADDLVKDRDMISFKLYFHSAKDNKFMEWTGVDANSD
jgi:hypothetical protein